MRVKKAKKEIKVICVDCGGDFTAFSRGALRCPECKKEHLRRIKAANQSRYRSASYIETKELRKPPKLSVGEVLCKLAEYNKVHGKSLSYGQFVQVLERGGA